jgi:ATP-binding cassette, subfamily F, member 3
LKADVWRDHLLKQEIALNAQLTGLEAEGDEKRFEEAREEASARLADVHSRLSDIDAESGPSRAAALLSGELCLLLCATILMYRRFGIR